MREEVENGARMETGCAEKSDYWRQVFYLEKERERADAAEKYGEPASYDFPNWTCIWGAGQNEIQIYPASYVRQTERFTEKSRRLAALM